MVETIREPLVVPPELARRLVLLRRQANLTHDPALDAAAVGALETAKRVTLRPDVLAHVAALGGDDGQLGVYDVVHGLEDEIASFYEASEPPHRGWRGDAKFDHVVFDAWGEWPRYYGVCARDPSAPAPFAVFDLKSGTFFDARYTTLAAYLDWRWGGAPGELGTDDDDDDENEPAVVLRSGTGEWQPLRAHADFDAPVSDAELAAFAPALLRALPLAVRHVLHPKFGRGVVLREREGKLEVDFGEHGVKRLAPSFVTEAT